MGFCRVLAVVFLASSAGCRLGLEDREEGRRMREYRASIRLLNEMERAGSSTVEWPTAAMRLVHQRAAYVTKAMVERALGPGDRDVRQRLTRLLTERTRRSDASGISSALAREIPRVQDKEGKRLALWLHPWFPTQEGYKLALSLLEDTDPQVRLWAVGSLCSDDPWCFGIDAAEEIAKRLHDQNRDVAKFTAGQMAFLRHGHVVALLRDHAKNIEDPLVKDIALESARRIEDNLKWRGLPDWAKMKNETGSEPKLQEQPDGGE